MISEKSSTKSGIKESFLNTLCFLLSSQETTLNNCGISRHYQRKSILILSQVAHQSWVFQSVHFNQKKILYKIH
jgi:hypothetical protein